MDIKTKNAYKEIFESYYNPLCNYALSILKDKEKAADVVQDVFVQLWQKRFNIKIQKDLQSYLFRSTKNKSIELIRREKLHHRYENYVKDMDGSDADADQEGEKFLRIEQLYTYVRQLPPKCQEVFILSKMNGLTYREIAEELNISIKTVENQIGRALHLLRIKFGQKK